MTSAPSGKSLDLREDVGEGNATRLPLGAALELRAASNSSISLRAGDACFLEEDFLETVFLEAAFLDAFFEDFLD